MAGQSGQRPRHDKPGEAAMNLFPFGGICEFLLKFGGNLMIWLPFTPQMYLPKL